MSYQRGRITSENWRDIQNAVSNSDLPNERRAALLDRIDWELSRAEAVERAIKETGV